MLLSVSGCRNDAPPTTTDTIALFSDCKATVEAASILTRHFADDGFDVLDREASARSTGQNPSHPVDILAVNARDDVVELAGQFDPRVAEPGAPAGGFKLRIRHRHRPDLPADADLQAKFLDFVTRALACRPAEPAQIAAEKPDAYLKLVGRLRLEMSRYR